MGYGSATFDNAIKSIQEIYGLFDRNVPEESLESWAPTSSMAQGCVFEASNRFFTSKREAPDMEPVPISPLIDPRGILETLKKEDFVHGEENEVYYYRVRENASRRSKRYESTYHSDPITIHNTDNGRKCGSSEPPNLSSWRHRRSASFIYCSTSEGQETQNDHSDAVHCTAGSIIQPGKLFKLLCCMHPHLLFLLTNVPLFLGGTKR